MSETKDKEETKKKKPLRIGGKGTLSLKGASGSVAPRRQSIIQGRGPAVSVEVRRSKRSAVKAQPGQNQLSEAVETAEDAQDDNLTDKEREARIKALRDAEEFQKNKTDTSVEGKEPTKKIKDISVKSAGGPASKKSQREKELEELQRIENEQRKQQEDISVQQQALEGGKPDKKSSFRDADAEEEESYRARMKRQTQRRPSRTGANRRRPGKLTVTQVLNEDYARERGPSLAAQRRAREKARMAAQLSSEPQEKQSREIIVPEAITIQELANRMAERSRDVIKALMKMDVMATINQSIDADTAELIIEEFGHTIKRVTEADIEIGLEGTEDNEKDMKPRPPVVTIMGHVDHGKTSLLDVLRQTDVVASEAGGITQHIGAYQVALKSGNKITFLDTPGHAAFTEMRARGANVTDIVVLVVAANDSTMPQTIEAIRHAKAAEVPIIVAINKIDLPDADVTKVKNDLLQHEVIPEDMGGDVLCIEVSAKQKQNLDKLEDAILLQAEMLDLKANPDRDAVGSVIEAKMEQGRGNVATVLIQKGTLKIGDIFVVGRQWGRVRAMINDQGKNIESAIPGQPIEVLGLNGTPDAGDQLFVVENEARAREVSDYRARKKRQASNAISIGEASFDELLAHAQESEREALDVIIKADVHGSAEAIVGSLHKIAEEDEELKVNVLHMGVGGITESDVTLANASNALIIGFNVRANTQARELAEKEGVDVRYYNVIYNVIDDAKAILSGMLSPIMREEYLGQAEIREIFRVTKVGNIAGCKVTKGMVKRGAKVRLLRDDVVIHEGTLKTLKRFKDEVKEVKEGVECGMAFEGYDDIKENDFIECYEIVEEIRTLD